MLYLSVVKVSEGESTSRKEKVVSEGLSPDVFTNPTLQSPRARWNCSGLSLFSSSWLQTLIYSNKRAFFHSLVTITQKTSLQRKSGNALRGGEGKERVFPFGGAGVFGRHLPSNPWRLFLFVFLSLITSFKGLLGPQEEKKTPVNLKSSEQSAHELSCAMRP